MKSRNHVILAMIRSSKRTTVHEKAKKAVRQQDKINLKKGLVNDA